MLWVMIWPLVSPVPIFKLSPSDCRFLLNREIAQRKHKQHVVVFSCNIGPVLCIASMHAVCMCTAAGRNLCWGQTACFLKYCVTGDFHACKTFNCDRANSSNGHCVSSIKRHPRCNDKKMWERFFCKRISSFIMTTTFDITTSDCR